ncbi:unnamed protein product [Rotaria sordida]|uniref:Ankyrin repeat protein n=2 Tax=Rotaria sordida TaxID=392033 RepID=A0A814NXD5_9BILA|nr:unnamed protein product [Rotaria sordida]CAF1097171.1 unnamed protein product [Rotaria sordida]
MWMWFRLISTHTHSENFDVVELLLKHGADSNAITKLSSTLFLLASKLCDLDTTEPCVEASNNLDFAPIDSDTNELNTTGQTAFFIATLNNHVDVMRFLIENGTDVNTTENGST